MVRTWWFGVAGLAAASFLLACVQATGKGEPKAKAKTGPAFRPLEQAVELGRVRWEGYDAARARARKLKRPLFVLFDEIPGCATCQNYGKRVLAHPLAVDAIQRLFVPALVRNNVKGRERELLSKFGEPTWANPSARVVAPEDERTLARVRGNYTLSGLIEAAAAGLKAAGKPLPAWISLHRRSGARLERVAFAMGCFWTGEARLGRLAGVTRTRTGWLAGSEVVEVEFDPRRLKLERLVAEAERMSCAKSVTCRSDAQAARLRKAGKQVRRSDDPIRSTPKDDKYQIRRGPYRQLPMTEAQATRVNALLGREQALAFLSPRQRELLALIKEHPKAGWPHALGVEFVKAFSAAEAVARTCGSSK
jgi:hypothetical protein